MAAAVLSSPTPGFWTANPAGGGAGGGYSLISNGKALPFRIARELKKRGLLSERATLPVLTGNAVGAGGAVNAGYNRAQYGNTGNLLPGGVQPIETVVAHSGVTTSTDEIAVDSFAVLNTQPVYPANGDGNPRFNAGG